MDINKIKLDKKFKLAEASAGTVKLYFSSYSFKKCLRGKVKPEDFCF